MPVLRITHTSRCSISFIGGRLVDTLDKRKFDLKYVELGQCVCQYGMQYILSRICVTFVNNLIR